MGLALLSQAGFLAAAFVTHCAGQEQELHWGRVFTSLFHLHYGEHACVLQSRTCRKSIHSSTGHVVCRDLQQSRVKDLVLLGLADACVAARCHQPQLSLSILLSLALQTEEQLKTR